jgi:hypothetical protein
MKKHGVYVDMRSPRQYNYFKGHLGSGVLNGARTDPQTGIIYAKDPKTGKDAPVGIAVDGVPCRGFKTPSRKFEIISPTVIEQRARLESRTTACRGTFPFPPMRICRRTVLSSSRSNGTSTHKHARRRRNT